MLNKIKSLFAKKPLDWEELAANRAKQLSGLDAEITIRQARHVRSNSRS